MEFWIRIQVAGWGHHRRVLSIAQRPRVWPMDRGNQLPVHHLPSRFLKLVIPAVFVGSKQANLFVTRRAKWSSSMLILNCCQDRQPALAFTGSLECEWTLHSIEHCFIRLQLCRSFDHTQILNGLMPCPAPCFHSSDSEWQQLRKFLMILTKSWT